ncbi:MAG TPA: DUF427 domain-containing protein [Micromonosporaceae bacterium]
MTDYPKAIIPPFHTEPVPRRIRAVLADQVVLDTTSARYVWEWPYYPQYYIPIADVTPNALVDERRTERLDGGTVHRYGLRAGEILRPSCVAVYTDDSRPGLAGMVRFDWNGPDAWFEEDEEVFVHPRNPYTRVDAVRSTRHIRVELDGVTLAESRSPVMVFETGLPTRYYLNRLEVNLAHLVPTDTITACPYKGRTTGYWSARIGDRIYRDLAWSYGFPTAQLQAIAGLIAFYNEKVDMFVNGRPVARPSTHFSSDDDRPAKWPADG